MADQVAIMLKFCKSADQAASQRELEKWIGKQLAKSNPLFLGDDDEELSTIFEIYLHDPSEATAIAKELAEKEEVEYAHEPAKRATKSAVRVAMPLSRCKVSSAVRSTASSVDTRQDTLAKTASPSNR